MINALFLMLATTVLFFRWGLLQDRKQETVGRLDRSASTNGEPHKKSG